MKFYLLTLFLALVAKEVVGHGMMIEPPNRSSMWRYNVSGSVPNYDDNQNFCGGLSFQTENGGQCGVCGDPVNAPHPQDNENTGRYGVGIVVATFEVGSPIDIRINLTANHIGAFTYSLCVLDDPNAPESGEDCFIPLLLENGASEYRVDKGQFDIYNRVQLPGDLRCDRCVLRWHYRAGNNWGQCDDGTYLTGCGPQETFRSCADIAIY